MKFKLSEISKISNGKKAVFYDDGTVPVYGEMAQSVRRNRTECG